MKKSFTMASHIPCICISASSDKEIEYIIKRIENHIPEVEIIRFKDVLKDITLLERCKFIFPIGGDGSVAWLIGKFFDKYGIENLSKLKPIVPVVRPESVGYLKQLDFEPKKFNRGFKKLLNKKYTIHNKAVLRITLDEKEYLAVNEINMSCDPHLGKYDVYIQAHNQYHKITTTRADGLFISTPIGSTGWGLSYGGTINLTEDALELVFVGGIHSSANFTLPREKILIRLELKNPSITPETLMAFKNACRKKNLNCQESIKDHLNIAFGPRIIVDGKLVAFDETTLEIDPSYSIPFVFLEKETLMDKARKLTKQQSVK
ncbi:MAG: NAD(+)/NADH kinase [Candidatus Heimdallarchaeota archaeon]|nr:NAD(+)/NADH kinase [Candidatus Heimdallarchaeota archaeon]